MRDRENRKRPRKVGSLEMVEHKYYIFCEGEQTEPRYFMRMKELIETHPVYKNMVLVEIEGCGAETMHVIQAAERYIQKMGIKDGQVWCVYDKDSFPAQRFNQVSERANNLNQKNTGVTYHTAWSNQCIEYWFVLHFAYYDSDNDRAFYMKFLDDRMKTLGLPKYEKKDIFDILLQYGNPKLAIRYAKKRLQENSGRTDTEVAPGTKVHLLVEELAKYLPEDIKEQIIES